MTGTTTVSNQHKTIERAAKVKNPFESLAADYATFKNDDVEVSVYCKWKDDMDSKTLKWAFKLAERNVSPFYESGPIGWQPKVKQRDLNKSWARYLVAVDKQKNAIGYAMFRFDMDYGRSVLYCYEMQVVKEYQRKGLGKFIMTILEKMAKQYEMEKLVLTVLTNNAAAITFFKSLGFAVDDTSPEISENGGYQIMSKLLF